MNKRLRVGLTLLVTALCTAYVIWKGTSPFALIRRIRTCLGAHFISLPGTKTENFAPGRMFSTQCGYT